MLQAVSYMALLDVCRPVYPVSDVATAVLGMMDKMGVKQVRNSNMHTLYGWNGFVLQYAQCCTNVRSSMMMYCVLVDKICVKQMWEKHVAQHSTPVRLVHRVRLLRPQALVQPVKRRVCNAQHVAWGTECRGTSSTHSSHTSALWCHLCYLFFGCRPALLRTHTVS